MTLVQATTARASCGPSALRLMRWRRRPESRRSFWSSPRPCPRYRRCDCSPAVMGRKDSRVKLCDGIALGGSNGAGARGGSGGAGAGARGGAAGAGARGGATGADARGGPGGAGAGARGGASGALGPGAGAATGAGAGERGDAVAAAGATGGRTGTGAPARCGKAVNRCDTESPRVESGAVDSGGGVVCPSTMGTGKNGILGTSAVEPSDLFRRNSSELSSAIPCPPRLRH